MPVGPSLARSWQMSHPWGARAAAGTRASPEHPERRRSAAIHGILAMVDRGAPASALHHLLGVTGPSRPPGLRATEVPNLCGGWSAGGRAQSKTGQVSPATRREQE